MAAAARQARRPRSPVRSRRGSTSRSALARTKACNSAFRKTRQTALSILIQKAVTFDIKIPGPATDGIDHNHDVFALLLNPLLTVSEFPGNNVQVVMGVDGPTMNIQYVYAGWLNGAQ